MSDIRVKICGVRSEADIDAVARAGAHYAGLVFFEKSPRNLGLDQAQQIAVSAPVGLAKVALVVDADDATLDAIIDKVPLDMLQLHGKETPARVAEVRARYGLPVMKAMGVADESDLADLLEMSLAADQLLIDAKATDLPGGNGISFDWRLVGRRRWLRPWMLAGGLTPDNVAEAIRLTNVRQVDVSSGVESARGVKDHDRITAFVRAATGPLGGVPRLR